MTTPIQHPASNSDSRKRAAEEIVICRRDAKPVPQYEGSEHLLVPASRQCVDFIEFDLRHIDDPDEALLLWHAAQGAAYALNLGVIQ